jgi:hypothetical protein
MGLSIQAGSRNVVVATLNMNAQLSASPRKIATNTTVNRIDPQKPFVDTLIIRMAYSH